MQDNIYNIYKRISGKVERINRMKIFNKMHTVGLQA